MRFFAVAKKVKNYTEEEKEEIGKVLASILCLKKEPYNNSRYQTTWGNKTGQGIFNTILRFADNIREGKEIKI